MPRACLHTVDVLSDEAVVAARSRLNPAAGVMLSALWVAPTGQLVLIVHHLAVDGVSWRILLEDLNIAWAQHHGGQPVALPAAGDVVCPVGVAAGRARAAPAAWWSRPRRGGRWRRPRRRCRRCNRRWIRMPVPGSLSVELDAETTRMLLGEVPAAFHAGVQRHSVDRVRVGVAEFLGTGARADRHRCRRATGAHEELAGRCGLVAHGGVVHHQVPGVVGRRRAGLGAGGGR